MTSKETLMMAMASLTEEESVKFLDYLLDSPMVVTEVEPTPEKETKVEKLYDADWDIFNIDAFEMDSNEKVNS